jgi:hypothetical protein
MISKALLWLFVIDLGIVFGAGVYEARISISRWMASGWHPEEALRDDTGRRFWAFTTTVPLTLLTVGNLWVGWQSSGELRIWWLAAAFGALADRVSTFGYFIPRMLTLMRTPDSVTSQATMSQWAKLNHGRLLLVALAWIAALQTFALSSGGAR